MGEVELCPSPTILISPLCYEIHSVWRAMERFDKRSTLPFDYAQGKLRSG